VRNTTTRDITWSTQDDALSALTFYLLFAGLSEEQIRAAWDIVAQSYNALHEFIPSDAA
jgi:hypothetical protein